MPKIFIRPSWLRRILWKPFKTKENKWAENSGYGANSNLVDWKSEREMADNHIIYSPEKQKPLPDLRVRKQNS